MLRKWILLSALVMTGSVTSLAQQGSGPNPSTGWCWKILRDAVPKKLGDVFSRIGWWRPSRHQKKALAAIEKTLANLPNDEKVAILGLLGRLKFIYNESSLTAGRFVFSHEGVTEGAPERGRIIIYIKTEGDTHSLSFQMVFNVSSVMRKVLAYDVPGWENYLLFKAQALSPGEEAEKIGQFIRLLQAPFFADVPTVGPLEVELRHFAVLDAGDLRSVLSLFFSLSEVLSSRAIDLRDIYWLGFTEIIEMPTSNSLQITDMVIRVFERHEAFFDKAHSLMETLYNLTSRDWHRIGWSSGVNKRFTTFRFKPRIEGQMVLAMKIRETYSGRPGDEKGNAHLEVEFIAGRVKEGSVEFVPASPEGKESLKAVIVDPFGRENSVDLTEFAVIYSADDATNP